MDNPRTGKDIVFYDGHCGLCHGAVRFIVAQDREGKSFLFAPLQGAAFQEAVPTEKRAALPDSIIVLTADGRLLIKSQAFIHILKTLGGYWRILGTLISVIPRAIRDALYDVVARVRHKVFPKPDQTCPLLPPDLRERFLI